MYCALVCSLCVCAFCHRKKIFITNISQEEGATPPRAQEEVPGAGHGAEEGVSRKPGLLGFTGLPQARPGWAERTVEDLLAGEVPAGFGWAVRVVSSCLVPDPRWFRAGENMGLVCEA